MTQLPIDVWKTRLGLNDWSISVRIVPKSELPENRSGMCRAIVKKKSAEIILLDPRDADESWLNQYDLELTLVHELLHIHFVPWSLLYPEGDQAELFLEQTVHVLSTTLVQAARLEGVWAM
jgi:hypothetical protein